MAAAVFYANAVLAVLTAAVVILHRNPVIETLALVVHLCSIAIFFVLLQAPFAAVIQVILYAGAIMVLFLFVVMMLDPGGEGESGRAGTLHLSATILGALALLAAVLPILIPVGRGVEPPAGFGGVESFSKLLFTEFMFPFEAVSILLLSAMIGALYLAKRELE
jgi:NADH-quinone oxidoreductase subunit J